MSPEKHFSSKTARSILVAYEPGDICNQIIASINALGHSTETVMDGNQAWALLRSHPFDLLVVDAGISGKPSYELCDDINSKHLSTKVVLVASVYRKTRYKRRPNSLYGAHDYVEQHHVHDKLPEKICSLFGSSLPTGYTVSADLKKMEKAGDSRLQPNAKSSFEKKRLVRLARIVASDMVLYNPDLIKKTPADFTEQEQQDLAHGGRFLGQMLPSEELDTHTLLVEALSFLRNRKNPLRKEDRNDR